MIKNGRLICLQIHVLIVSLVLENRFPENALHSTSNSGNLVIEFEYYDVERKEREERWRGGRGERDGGEKRERRREKGIGKRKRQWYSQKCCTF